MAKQVVNTITEFSPFKSYHFIPMENNFKANTIGDLKRFTANLSWKLKLRNKNKLFKFMEISAGLGYLSYEGSFIEAPINYKDSVMHNDTINFGFLGIEAFILRNSFTFHSKSIVKNLAFLQV